MNLQLPTKDIEVEGGVNEGEIGSSGKLEVLRRTDHASKSEVTNGKLLRKLAQTQNHGGRTIARGRTREVR